MKNLLFWVWSLMVILLTAGGLTAQEEASAFVTGDVPAAAPSEALSDADAGAVPAVPSAEADGTESGMAITGLRVGIDGCWKAGMITPVAVYLNSGEPGKEYRLEFRSVDSDKTPTAAVSIIRYKGPDQPVYGQFLPGQASADLEIAVLDAESGKPLACRRFSPAKVRENALAADNGPIDPADVLFRYPVDFSRPLWLSTAAEPNGLSEAAGLWRSEERDRPQVLTLTHFSDLPSDRHGYDAVAVLFLSGSNSAFFEGTDPQDVRFTALEKWIQTGGRLVISGGKDSIPILTGPLARFLPGTIGDKTKEIRIVNDLIQFVPNTKKLVMTGTLDHPFLNLPVLSPADDAVIDLTEGGLPMIARQVRGLGSITYFAGDTAELPLAAWNGQDRIWLGILGAATERERSKSASGGLIQLGYSDLSGQLRSALDRFDGVKNFPFSLILILIGLYVLVIGPLDWFLVHRVFKKPNMTWLTLPLWLVIFSAAALVIGNRIHPKEPKCNQAELVDWDAATGLIRGSVWAGLYSPSDDLYSMSLIPAVPGEAGKAPNKEVLFGGLGLAGSGLGGTEQKTIAPAYWSCSYETLVPKLTVPVRVLSTKSFFGEWTAEAGADESAALTLKNGDLTGTVTNRFSAPLTDAILFYENWAYRVGTLEPGESFSVDRRTPKIDSSRIYGGAKDPFNEGRTNTMTQSGLDRYNTTSTDPADIFRMMMFYQTAGGLSEVGLTNSRHHRLDCRELLRGGRAVLTGTLQAGEGNAPVPRTDLITARGDQEESAAVPHSVFLRYFCPVMPESR